MASKKDKITYKMDGDTLKIVVTTRDAKKIIELLKEALKSG